MVNEWINLGLILYNIRYISSQLRYIRDKNIMHYLVPFAVNIRLATHNDVAQDVSVEHGLRQLVRLLLLARVQAVVHASFEFLQARWGKELSMQKKNYGWYYALLTSIRPFTLFKSDTFRSLSMNSWICCTEFSWSENSSSISDHRLDNS